MKRGAMWLLVGICAGLIAAGLLLIVAGQATPVRASPGILYVAPGGDCGDAIPCFDTLQAAVDAADAGDEMRIAAGTYSGVSHLPALSTATFTATQVVAITRDLTLRGGYSPSDWQTSDPLAHPTVLDAQGQGRVMLVHGDITVTVAGLHITGGDSTALGGAAGVHVTATQGALVFSDNQVYGNLASPSSDWAASAGGLYANARRVTLSNNNWHDNTGAVTGGAIVRSPQALVEGNTFSANTAQAGNSYAGGGLSATSTGSFEIRANTFAGNSAYGGGGLAVGGPITLSHNLITANRAVYSGGVHIPYGSTVLVGNLITGNVANQAGGGVGAWGYLGTVTLHNNYIADNVMNGGRDWFLGGGSAILSYNRSLELAHNTLANNDCPDGDGSAIFLLNQTMGGSIQATLVNNIVLGHTLGISVTANTTVTVDSVLWHDMGDTVWAAPGAAVTVRNERWGDPAFAADGYHLTAGSPALDWGVDTSVPFDIDRQGRRVGLAPDLGADEYMLCLYLPMIR